MKKFPVILLTDNLMGDANLGSLFRLADAFNIEKIVFCGTPVNLDSNRLKRTARTTHRSVPHEHRESTTEAIFKYKAAGYTALALEITTDSVALESREYKNEEKILLIVGNESHGISLESLELADQKVHITMFGRNSSMNVAQAAGIALYEITKTLPPFGEK